MILLLVIVNNYLVNLCLLRAVDCALSIVVLVLRKVDTFYMYKLRRSVRFEMLEQSLNIMLRDFNSLTRSFCVNKFLLFSVNLFALICNSG